MDPVVHFEIPFDDRARMTAFYEAVFGWKTQSLGQEMGDYVLATTADADAAGQRPPGSIDGGFYPRRPDWPAQHPSLVIAVSHIGEAMQRVKAAGGQVLGDPMEIAGVGQYVSFTDTEGNRLSLLQPVPRT
jgi:hypothetical protein